MTGVTIGGAIGGPLPIIGPIAGRRSPGAGSGVPSLLVDRFHPILTPRVRHAPSRLASSPSTVEPAQAARPRPRVRTLSVNTARAS